jgi:hypothetical protein
MEGFTLDFIGVGAAKSATTWLHECLQAHPQVCVPVLKELGYFCSRTMWPKLATNRNQGERWLRAMFSHCQTGQLRGEISTAYLVDPESPKLLSRRFPDVKIIVSYRNPVDSLYAFFYELSKRHNVAATFEDFVAEHSFVTNYGFYCTHTMRYLDVFPRERVHFILFDDIVTDPETVIVDLYAFLGIETAYLPPQVHHRVNVRKAPRYVLLRNIVGGAQELVNRSPRALKVRTLIRRLGIHRFFTRIQEWNLRAASFPPMRVETRERLVALYSEENVLLGQLIDRDLSHWNE